MSNDRLDQVKAQEHKIVVLTLLLYYHIFERFVGAL